MRATRAHRSFIRLLVTILALAHWAGGSSSPLEGEACPPGVAPEGGIAAELSAAFESDPTCGVDFTSGEYVYMGNAFDFDAETVLKEVKLTLLTTQTFQTGEIRVWIHSAARGCTGVSNVTKHFDRVLELDTESNGHDGIRFLEPDELWIDTPLFHSFWIRLLLEDELSNISVLDQNDILVVGFVMKVSQPEGPPFIPGFVFLGDFPPEDVPLDSSIYTDENGDVKLGLTWEYLLGLFPTDELREMERAKGHEEYSIYIQIHAEPATEDPR